MCMALYSPNGVGGTFVIPRLQPIRDPDLRSPAAATWQLPIGQPLVTWKPRQHRSTPATVGQRRSTAAGHGGDRGSTVAVNAAGHRSTVAVNNGRRWRTTVDCRWTTVDHHRTTGQRCTMMTCHPPIRPAATCTVPRTQMISRQPPLRGSFLLDSRQ
uniref:Uncharacterized protein n=1 Tax=Tanacetum cinerariifolium TaxID=118510 RepID=A0A699L0A3_TANCI|nr:hypothetical protein [Tanacetum cinerariifolium]